MAGAGNYSNCWKLRCGNFNWSQRIGWAFQVHWTTFNRQSKHLHKWGNVGGMLWADILLSVRKSEKNQNKDPTCAWALPNMWYTFPILLWLFWICLFFFFSDFYKNSMLNFTDFSHFPLCRWQLADFSRPPAAIDFLVLPILHRILCFCSSICVLSNSTQLWHFSKIHCGLCWQQQTFLSGGTNAFLTSTPLSHSISVRHWLPMPPNGGVRVPIWLYDLVSVP